MHAELITFQSLTSQTPLDKSKRAFYFVHCTTDKGIISISIIAQVIIEKRAH